MAFVGEDDGVVGNVLEQGRGGSPGCAAGQVAGIVLDAVAGAGGLQHLEVEPGALLEPLGLDQLALGDELLEPDASSSRIDLIAWVRVGRGVT